MEGRGIFLLGCIPRRYACQDREVVAAWTSHLEGTGKVCGILGTNIGGRRSQHHPRHSWKRSCRRLSSASSPQGVDLGSMVHTTAPGAQSSSPCTSLHACGIHLPNSQGHGIRGRDTTYPVVGVPVSVMACKGELLRNVHRQTGDPCLNAQCARAPRRDGPARSPWTGESAARRAMTF